MRLHLDFETRSEVDLADVGTYRYATHPSTRVLMLAYAARNDDPSVWLPGDPFPAELADWLDDPFVEKWAWHAAFERLVFTHVLGMPMRTEEFRCAQVLGRYHSLPGKLEDAGAALGLAEDERKLADGKRLIKLFSEPYREAADKPLFGMREAIFLGPHTHPAEWESFKHYAKGDVRSERGIVQKLDKIDPLPQREWENYWLDQELNDRGVPVDVALVRGARQVIAIEKQRLFDELRSITRVENPNSDQQMLAYVRSEGYPFSKIGKAFVQRALAGEGEITPDCRRALELRLQLAKSSVDKFDAFEKMLVGGRLRQQFVFMGAARTGREASKGINIQNLLRPVKELEDEEKLNQAIALLTAGDIVGIRSGFKSSVLDVAASCLRSVFRAPDGRFVIADLSQIESIVLGWVSGCKRILQVYTATDGRNDAYKDFATEMYQIPYEQVTKAQRNMAKAPVLGCGYRLSAGMEMLNAEGDTVKTGLLGYAAAMGIEMRQADTIRAVKIFREKFKEIVRLWYTLEDAFVSACSGVPTAAGKCRFEVKDDVLRVQLPSGRCLHYIRPRVVRATAEGRNGSYEKKHLSYMGQSAETHQWVEIETHGGKLVENCLAGDTVVVTDGGLKPLRSVTTADRVWDGEAWVQHDGLVRQGVQEVGEWLGLVGTTEHKILVGNEWTTLGQMDATTSAGALSRGRDSVPWPLWNPKAGRRELLDSCVTADGYIPWIPEPCSETTYRRVRHARATTGAGGSSLETGMALLAMTPFGTFGYTGAPVSFRGATTPNAGPSRTTEPGVSRCISRGETIRWNGCATSLVCRIGINPAPIWTGKITTETTNRATCESSIDAQTPATEETAFVLDTARQRIPRRNSGQNLRLTGVSTRSTTISNEGSLSKPSWTFIGKEEVYDLRNSGPNRRFMVLTQSGPVLVHNCVQAIARDVLFEGLRRARRKGFDVVAHTHDEIMAEVLRRCLLTFADLEQCMTDPIQWAPGLPLKAAGFESEVYRKG